MKSIVNSRSLFVQMMIAFIAIVFLASVAIGVPAIWLLQNQLDRQAWSQVDQGQRVTRALYDFYYNEILDLATLTAQRPTLQELLLQNETNMLSDYLITLEKGAGLDQIVVCDAQVQIAAATVTPADDSICTRWKTGRYQYEKNSGKVCLSASHPIEHEGGAIGEVFVCSILDDSFSAQLSDQTGLEHLLWNSDLLVATSLTSEAGTIETASTPPNLQGESFSKRTTEIAKTPYYSGFFSLDEAGLVAEVSLDVTGLISTRTRLIRIVAASILAVSAVGSILGILLVNRINRPLVQLSDAAAGFSTGDLETPVQIETRLNEITQVADTLENARLDLLATLTSLETERDWSEHLLASIVEGIVTIDNELRVTFFSRGAERILGWKANQAIGRIINEIIQFPDNEKEFDHILPALLESRQNVDVLLPGHRVASLAITGANLTRSGERKTEIVLVFRDISKEEAVHRLLGQFLANTAHEFRTPLSALEASVELLLDQASKLSENELLELHTSLHLGVLGLHTLVDNLLESANIEARRFRISPKPCDLRDVIAEALQTMQPLLTKYEQELAVELPVDDLIVYADPRRTVQVLINLISNASRYGPPNEEIGLRVTGDDEYARVEVMDRGPGISPEDRINLFRRFVFPQSPDKVSPTGAGLGLSVVEAIVSAHGGKVGVEDRSGTGSIFWFTLPLDKESL